MDNIVLSEDEINRIKEFIEDAKGIPSVDGIYIEAYKAINTNINPIYVNALINDSIDYKDRLVKQGYILDYNIIRNQEDELREKYLDYSSRIKFIVYSSDIYSPMLMKNVEINAERSLLSGTILFDRFGNLKDNMNYVSKLINGYDTAIQIENIDKSMDNVKQKKLEV